MPDPITTILALAGGATAVTALAIWYSPYMLRWLAAHCLLQAGALESYQEYRRDHLNRQMVACGVRKQEVTDENG